MVKISRKSEAKPLVEKSNEGTVLVGTIPDGIPKSGRKWKIRQTFRSSAQDRQGVSAKLCKTYNARMAEKQKFDEMKALERQMREEKELKEKEIKEARELRQKIRMQNEYKTSSYQVINPEKMKGMSKKQLRNIKKTQVAQNGAVQLVDLYDGRSGMKKILGKKR